MTPFEILSDALTYPSVPRTEWTSESMQFALDITTATNPTHGKADPLRTLRWSEDVIPKLVHWALVNRENK